MTITMKFIVAVLALTSGCSHPIPVPAVSPNDAIRRITLGVGLSDTTDICFEEWNLQGTDTHMVDCIDLRDMRLYAKSRQSRAAN